MFDSKKRKFSLKPFSQKYQPKTIDELFLDPKTKEKLFSMKKKKSVPNLILTGPPGSGKTSTSE